MLEVSCSCTRQSCSIQLTSWGYNLTNNRAQSRRELNLSFSIIKQTSTQLTGGGRGLDTTKSFFKDDLGQAPNSVLPVG